MKPLAPLRHPLRPWPGRLSQHLLVSAAIVSWAPTPVAAQAAAVAAAAGPEAISYRRVEGGFQFTLTRSEGNAVDVRRDGRDVILRFARSTPAFDANELAARAAGWLDGVSVGHDALLLRLSGGVDVQIRDDVGSPLTLRFSRTAKPDGLASAPDDPGRAGAQRLDLLRARLLLQDGELAQARQHFEALRTAMPDSSEPVAGLAALESRARRWRQSVALYREAQSMNPADPALARAAQAVAQAQAGGTRVDLDRRRSRDGAGAAPVTLGLISVEAAQRLGEAWKLGIDLDTASIDTSAVQRTDGSVRAFSGERARAALFAQHDALDGTVHAISLFFNNGSGGLGLSRRQLEDQGTTTFALDVRRPHWDDVEGIIERAHRDRISAAREHRFGPAVTGRAEVGLNRYGLPGARTVGRSVSVSADLRWSAASLIEGLSATYRLDAEYMRDIEVRVLPAGGSYSPLPLLDREVHTVALECAAHSGQALAGGTLGMVGQIGVASDRYGRSGPVAAASLTWTRPGAVAQLRASHTRDTGRSRGTNDGVAGFVAINF